MIKKQFSTPSMETKHVITLLRQALREMKMEKKSQILEDKEGVRLRVEGNVFFPSGKAKIKKEGLVVLDKIGKIIAQLPYKVRVEGHTDNLPLSKNSLFPSNWELSAARAGAVIRYFISKDDLTADRFLAVGFADTVPIVPNDTPEHRAKNRRVEFLFSTAEKSDQEGLTFDKETFSLKDDIKDMFGSAKQGKKNTKETVTPKKENN
jgi:chemotaxis protein MotB